jgi:cell division protein FtsB
MTNVVDRFSYEEVIKKNYTLQEENEALQKKVRFLQTEINRLNEQILFKDDYYDPFNMKEQGW